MDPKLLRLEHVDYTERGKRIEIMIDGFANAYPDILAEVKRKEPLVEQENYDVPELGLHRAQLSRILEEIYYRFVEKKAFTQKQAESVI